MDAAVGNLADAGDQPALDRQRVGKLAARPRAAAVAAGARHRAGQPGEAGGERGLVLARCRSSAGERARLLAEHQGAVGFGDARGRQAAASATRWRRLEARRARRGARCSACAAGEQGAARLLGLAAQRRRCARPRRGARRCGARISGRVAASSERTWTASSHRAGLDQRQRRRAAAPSSAAPRSAGSPAPGASASRARCAAWSAAISAMRALGGGEVGLGRLRSARPAPRASARARSASLVARRAWRSSVLEAARSPAPPRACACGRAPRRRRAPARRWRRSRRASRARAGEEERDVSCPLSFPMIGVVRKDARRAEQLLGEHGAGEQMRPGRLPKASSRSAARRSASPKPSAPPIRKRASRRPSSRQRSSRRASSTEHSASPFSSSRTVTLLSGAGGARPPLSGSSVTFTGQAMRFR